MKKFKQVILVRQDLKLPKGKMAAQVGHACIEAFIKTDKADAIAWRLNGQRKIVLKVPDEKSLKKFLVEAKNSGFSVALITDAGKTCIAPGTITCLGIGPADEEALDRLTGELGMM